MPAHRFAARRPRALWHPACVEPSRRGKPRTALVLAALAFLLAACKSPEERLFDLDRSLDDRYQLNPAVYDAGQNVHETYRHFVGREDLTIEQAAFAVWYGSHLLEKSEVPLLRADALSFMARLVTHFPLPPADEPYVEREDLIDFVKKTADLFGEHGGILGVESLLAGLESPDRVARDEAYEELVKRSGEDFGRDAAAWQAWWERDRDRLRAEAAEELRRPLEDFGRTWFPTLPPARGVLGLVFKSLPTYAEAPGLPEVAARTLQSLTRRVIVHSVAQALSDPHPDVRVAAARAAIRIQDPSFDQPLARALANERDPHAKTLFIRAASLYPTREAVRAFIFAQVDPDPAVATAGREALAGLLEPEELEYGQDLDAWGIWWERTGSLRWP